MRKSAQTLAVELWADTNVLYSTALTPMPSPSNKSRPHPIHPDGAIRHGTIEPWNCESSHSLLPHSS